MRIRLNRPIAAALAVAVTLSSFDLVPAHAAPKNSNQTQASQSTATTTDLSARRRWGRGNAAALGAVIGVFGAIAAIAAADQYRNGYYGDPGYGYGYGYAPGYRYGYRHHHHHWR
jgi:hypothetical protein